VTVAKEKLGQDEGHRRRRRRVPALKGVQW